MKKLCIAATLIAFCAVSIVPSPSFARDGNVVVIGAMTALSLGLLLPFIMIGTIGHKPRQRHTINKYNEPKGTDKTINNEDSLKGSKNNRNSLLEGNLPMITKSDRTEMP